MISERIKRALEGSSAIRAMFVEGKELAERVGAENVYDFSLGNPATPAPASLAEAVQELTAQSTATAEGSAQLHGYMDNAGYPQVRAAVAENLNRRFGTSFDFHNITMTVGAAGGPERILPGKTLL